MINPEIESLTNEVLASRNGQANSEFAREMACDVISKIATACAYLTPDKLDTLNHLITRSLQLVGAVDNE